MTDEIDPAFWEGVNQFNQHQFYECHDTLEAIWMEAIEPQRSFYQGILQIAVAFYHLGNANLRGATILLGEGMQRLHHYPPDYGNVDLDTLVAQSTEILRQLQALQQTASEAQPVAQPDAQPDAPSFSPPALPLIIKISAK